MKTHISGRHIKAISSTSLRSATSLLCHVLLVGLAIETRIKLSQHVAASTGCHRGLKDDAVWSSEDAAAYATATEAKEKPVSLEAQVAQQTRSLAERIRTGDVGGQVSSVLDLIQSMRVEMAELQADVRQLKLNQTEASRRIHVTRTHSNNGTQYRGSTVAHMTDLTAKSIWREIESLKRNHRHSDQVLKNVSARVEDLRSSHHAEKPALRKLQGAEPEPEPDPALGEFVQQIKREVVKCGGPGGTTSDGSFDYSRCAVHTFAQCHVEACAGHLGSGHRRSQSSCSADEVSDRSAEITLECCDEVGEDCSGGYPHTCNLRCAEVFLPFWRDCRDALGKGSGRFEPVVALCQAAAPGPAPAASGGSFAQQLSVACADDSFSHEECIPECTAQLHGFLLLLNIDGNDSKLSCELHHGKYSWMGEATDGKRSFLPCFLLLYHASLMPKVCAVRWVHWL